MTEDQINKMVDRFLAWRLPEDFRPDAGISFKADFNEHTAYPMKHKPTGTNLFTAAQATEMVQHMVAGQSFAMVDALKFYADPENWIDTPSWDGDPSCITPKAIPVTKEQDGSRPCDCGDVARAALAASSDLMDSDYARDVMDIVPVKAAARSMEVERHIAEPFVPNSVIKAFEDRYNQTFDLAPFDGEWGNTHRYKHDGVQQRWEGWRDSYLTLAKLEG